MNVHRYRQREKGNLEFVVSRRIFFKKSVSNEILSSFPYNHVKVRNGFSRNVDPNPKLLLVLDFLLDFFILLFFFNVLVQGWFILGQYAR